MRWISNLFTGYWRRLHFITIILLSLALLYRNDGLSTIVSDVTITVLYYPFSKIKQSLDELVGVSKENRELRARLADSVTRVSMMEEAARENIRLRSVLGFEPPSGYTLLPAEVISSDGIKIPTSAVISHGYSDGVVTGEPIINEEGLIGKVVSVSEHYATVQLLTDPANRVAVRVAESREMGISKYVMSKGLTVDNIPVRGDVKPGDQILTSGLGGLYPPGLKVGTVIAVDHTEGEPFLQVRLAPAADFNSLDELFVLRAKGR
jgi:rod shape-determining protein MreC